MPDFVHAVFKSLRLPIPVKKDLPSDLVSSIELEDITVRLPKECPQPLITGLITTFVRIPKGLRKVKFMTTGIKAEFYLLHPEHRGRIARLQTDGWHESSLDKRERLWKIEANVTDAPVEIVDGKGFDEWIGKMIEHEGEDMKVSVEGWCSAGIKIFGTKAKVKKIPVKATLKIPGLSPGAIFVLIAGIPKPKQLDPHCQNDLRVVKTTPSSASFTVHIFVQNTTPYTLNVKLLHCHLFHDGILIGEGHIEDEIILPCDRTCALARVNLLPGITDQSKESIISLFNNYVCGKKSEIEIRLHEKTVPSMPHLSKILSQNYSVTVVLPKLSPDQSSEDLLEAYDPSDDFVPQDGKIGSPNKGLESPLIYSAEMHIVSSTVRLTVFNPLNVPIYISKISGKAVHNESHIGDLAAPEDWSWTLEPGVQQTPKVPVSWSIISFGLDPMKGFSMIFDGWQRNGEVSVDVSIKATVKIGEMEMGEIETTIEGIATRLVL
jgi:LEA14-like dessication related protein